MFDTRDKDSKNNIAAQAKGVKKGGVYPPFLYLLSLNYTFRVIR